MDRNFVNITKFSWKEICQVLIASPENSYKCKLVSSCVCIDCLMRMRASLVWTRLYDVHKIVWNELINEWPLKFKLMENHLSGMAKIRHKCSLSSFRQVFIPLQASDTGYKECWRSAHRYVVYLNCYHKWVMDGFYMFMLVSVS